MKLKHVLCFTIRQKKRTEDTRKCFQRNYEDK